MAFSGLSMIGGGFTVLNPEFMDSNRWIGIVGIVAGALVLFWAIFLDIEIKWPLKLKFLWHRPWRIPLLDLYRLADARGWNFLSSGNLTVLDFATAFRQGALDGQIPVWGRAQQALDELTESEPLDKIPQDHWRNHELDPLAVLRYETSAQADGLTGENISLRTRTIPQSMHHGCFADLHVKRKEAIRWLRRDAAERLHKSG